MKDFIKRYWDIFGGVLTGVVVTILSKFDIYIIQLCYSIIILILVGIGVLRIVKQSIDKNKEKRPKKRRHNVIDDMIDAQKAVKAISLAAEPLKEGERLGKVLVEISRGGKRAMKKIKELWSKFKGYLLTVALGVLTTVEMCGGFINDMFNDALTVNGTEILPLITLGATIVVGCISNGYTKEQREKIKVLISNKDKDKDAIVQAEIKKSIKDNETALKDNNKALAIKETELENLQTELTNAKNTHAAKIKMYNMTPQLAKLEDVEAAAKIVLEIEENIKAKQEYINRIVLENENYQTTINALKSQL